MQEPTRPQAGVDAAEAAGTPQGAARTGGLSEVGSEAEAVLQPATTIETPKAAALLSALNGRPIVLVGMMGAGKTSVGKRLATRLGLEFVDADQAIEEAAQKTISEIFAEHGEAYFRDGERRVIRRLLAEGCKVIATGGGAFINPETRQAAQENGVTVWLKAEFNVLWDRVRRRPHRPLLQTTDPEGTLRKLIAERYPIYGLADVTVPSQDVPHEQVVDAVIEALVDNLFSKPASGK